MQTTFCALSFHLYFLNIHYCSGVWSWHCEVCAILLYRCVLCYYYLVFEKLNLAHKTKCYQFPCQGPELSTCVSLDQRTGLLSEWYSCCVSYHPSGKGECFGDRCSGSWIRSPNYVIKTRVGYKEDIYSCSIFAVYTVTVAVVEAHFICFP